MARHVKGVLFLDYVRMIRRSKATNWSDVLGPEDMVHIVSRVELEAWYPMETFERMGNAILAYIAEGDVQAARFWGRLSVDPLVVVSPNLLSSRDPVESLMRFRVLRSTFFDFEALSIPTLVEDHADVDIAYGMGETAEEAASFQTMGFFERLLELASATEIVAEFKERSWAGEGRTRLALRWLPPAR